MKKTMKILIITLLVIAAISAVFIVSAAISGQGVIEKFYDENGRELDGSVSERVNIKIGGRKNGMIIRGKSTDNPVLLFISGGPGVPQYWLNQYYDNRIEDYFTVCWWDYYGEGLSYSSQLKPGDITLDELEKNAVEVAEYLKKRFSKDRIYLMAHSGGTRLGLSIAQDYPENFYCYFAMSQAAGERHIYGYEYLKNYFENENNKKGLDLINRHVREENGQLTVYNDKNIESDWEKALLMSGCATTRKMRSDALEIFFPQMYSHCYTLTEKINFWKGKKLCQNSAYSDVHVSIENEPPVSIPVYFLSGRYDYTCPVNAVEDLYKNIDAPVKEMHIFENSAHSPLWEENEAVLEVMKSYVK
ncbi:MAG: alpha/beta hydrolase [Oscillospiraceae bacterium]|nr:alpha/beta hydrolase [Oscillospiraceae bacterium]